jgi:hypothetical protein
MNAGSYVRDLFASDVTRDIPPVVYFHEQTPAKLLAEVSEYIVTGGWPEDHPNHRRVPLGIHEQYVRLLTGITAELDKPGGPDLPNAWISGFYGSGKSSFAKLLGLALDGIALPDGRSLAEAWLRRDTSPRAAELRAAWDALRQKIKPLAVVFDIGAAARDQEHIHGTVVRRVQERLGYCKEPLVADFELALERAGDWTRFIQTALETLGEPWSAVKDRSLAEEDFSLVMSVLYPDRYTDPMSWFTSRGGTHSRSESPEEAVDAIRDMLRFRNPRATLFLVVDEVSQYVLSSKDRVDRLRAFATALGSGLRGRVWLLALGQQKLDEEADDSFLVWAKDRFPRRLRVHLAATNIRDVVHKRLLQKRPGVEESLRSLFVAHRPDLKLFAYGCETVTPEEFAEVYPMLPGQIDLILQITTALRTRSARAQGDDQAIRGLLQLLGELFRDQKLADQPVGALVTLDRIYEVQHTALDSDVQASMARILSQCSNDTQGLLVRVAKVVALLELIQETQATDARLVAQCLYDRVDRGNQLPEVTEALEELRRRNLLGYSEKHGYKLQSSAGEEWERERRDIPGLRDQLTAIIREALTWLVADPERPRLQGRPFPWECRFSDGRQTEDVVIADPRDEAALCADFRFLASDERSEAVWVPRSAESTFHNRLVWICGVSGPVEDLARDLHRSRAMVRKYKPRRESLNPSRRLLLQQEENRVEDLETLVRAAAASVWMTGRLYFRGRSLAPSEQGPSFALALQAAGNRFLPEIFPQFIPTQIQPSELLQLIEPDLSGPSPKFLSGDLGILEMDSGRYVPACIGVVPRRVQEYIANEGGVGGTTLLAQFGGPPYGYTANVVKACVAGLLRAGKVRLQPEGGTEITAIRDAGVRDLFDKDRTFRRTNVLPAGDDDIGFQARARICKFFEDALNVRLDREDHAIADAVAQHFPQLMRQLRVVQERLNRLPGSPAGPAVFVRLNDALEQCLRTCRQTRPTVKWVKKHLDVLRDGIPLLRIHDSELTDDALRAVHAAQELVDWQAAQLRELGAPYGSVQESVERLATHLKGESPWREIAALDPDLESIRRGYNGERQRLMQWQESQVEAARAQITARPGFSTLTADQAHQVLRPIHAAITDTSTDAIAPALAALRDPFLVGLHRAVEEANSRLDEFLHRSGSVSFSRVDLRLQNREVASEADVEALVAEIRQRLLEQVRSGARVRLM